MAPPNRPRGPFPGARPEPDRRRPPPRRGAGNCAPGQGGPAPDTPRDHPAGARGTARPAPTGPHPTHNGHHPQGRGELRDQPRRTRSRHTTHRTPTPQT
ncbi:hypothetical protein EF910_35845 [Streptomyces sp. WAC07149]|nr:hypothetical protein EF910_35845 [Streptomyces sp. WAC07149]